MRDEVTTELITDSDTSRERGEGPSQWDFDGGDSDSDVSPEMSGRLECTCSLCDPDGLLRKRDRQLDGLGAMTSKNRDMRQPEEFVVPRAERRCRERRAADEAKGIAPFSLDSNRDDHR